MLNFCVSPKHVAVKVTVDLTLSVNQTVARPLESVNSVSLDKRPPVTEQKTGALTDGFEKVLSFMTLTAMFSVSLSPTYELSAVMMMTGGTVGPAGVSC